MIDAFALSCIRCEDTAYTVFGLTSIALGILIGVVLFLMYRKRFKHKVNKGVVAVMTALLAMGSLNAQGYAQESGVGFDIEGWSCPPCPSYLEVLGDNWPHYLLRIVLFAVVTYVVLWLSALTRRRVLNNRKKLAS